MHLFQKFERRRECSVVLLVCVALVMTVGADITVGRCHAMVRWHMSPALGPGHGHTVIITLGNRLSSSTYVARQRRLQ